MGVGCAACLRCRHCLSHLCACVTLLLPLCPFQAATLAAEAAALQEQQLRAVQVRAAELEQQLRAVQVRAAELEQQAELERCRAAQLESQLRLERDQAAAKRAQDQAAAAPEPAAPAGSAAREEPAQVGARCAAVGKQACGEGSAPAATPQCRSLLRQQVLQPRCSTQPRTLPAAMAA